MATLCLCDSAQCLFDAIYWRGGKKEKAPKTNKSVDGNPNVSGNSLTPICGPYPGGGKNDPYPNLLSRILEPIDPVPKASMRFCQWQGFARTSRCFVFFLSVFVIYSNCFFLFCFFPTNRAIPIIAASGGMEGVLPFTGSFIVLRGGEAVSNSSPGIAMASPGKGPSFPLSI